MYEDEYKLLANDTEVYADEYVAATLAVKFRLFPDLSTHVDIVAAFAGGVPVPAGSFPSNQTCSPAMDVGTKMIQRRVAKP